MAAIKFTVEMPVAVLQEGEFFVAKCPLGVVSQGDSQDAAFKNLTEALQLFIETCFEQGIIEQVMKQKGFSLEGGFESADVSSDYPDGTLNVPFSLIAAGMGRGQTAYR